MDRESLNNIKHGSLVLLNRNISLPVMDYNGNIQDRDVVWGYYEVDFYDPNSNLIYLNPDNQIYLDGVSPKIIDIDDHCEKYNRGRLLFA